MDIGKQCFKFHHHLLDKKTHPSKSFPCCWHKSKMVKKRIMRRPKRKSPSFWIRPGRSDIWWKNILNGISAPEEWKENFRLTKDYFRFMWRTTTFFDKKIDTLKGTDTSGKTSCCNLILPSRQTKREWGRFPILSVLVKGQSQKLFAKWRG